MPRTVWISAGRAAVLELPPQRARVHLDEVRVIGVVAPDLAQQLVLREHLAAVADEERQQPQLGRRQRPGDGRRGWRRRRPRRRARRPASSGAAQPAGAAQHGAHPGEQLLEGERLDQVVVGAELEAGEPVVQPVAGGEEDDRDVPRGPQALGQREAVQAGQHDVEHREVGRGGAGCARLTTVGERRHGVPVGARAPRRPRPAARPRPRRRRSAPARRARSRLDYPACRLKIS